LSDGLYDPITRQKTYLLVAERLLELIGTRELGPGDPIPTERELGRLFCVGRSSIREALRMLQSNALIRREPNGSFAVAEFGNTLDDSVDFLLSVDQADLSELLEVRHMLEAEAAARRHESDIHQLTRETEGMEARLGSEHEFIKADLAFHMAIAQASRNRLIVHLRNAMRTLLWRSLASSLQALGAPEHAIEMHRHILDGTAACDPAEARRRMHEHMSRVEHDTSHRSKPVSVR
jgi:DNA-binding FadR family transcriptional regulator